MDLGEKKNSGENCLRAKTPTNDWPGFAILFLTATGSFLFHFWSSSCILSILAGFRAHKQPFREEFPDLFSTFSKHLFKDKLWRTEFFQPSGAVWRNKPNVRTEFHAKKENKIKSVCIYIYKKLCFDWWGYKKCYLSLYLLQWETCTLEGSHKNVTVMLCGKTGIR